MSSSVKPSRRNRKSSVRANVDEAPTSTRYVQSVMAPSYAAPPLATAELLVEEEVEEATLIDDAVSHDAVHSNDDAPSVAPPVLQSAASARRAIPPDFMGDEEATEPPPADLLSIFGDFNETEAR